MSVISPVVLVLVLVVALAGLAMVRHHEPAGRALALRRIGLGLMAALIGLGGVFIFGDTVDDPGGLAAVGLVALWLVPLVLLSWWAWRRPASARWPLAAATGLVVAVNLWEVFDSTGWRSFENGHGPVRAIATFALGGALACFGFRRPRLGGILLLVAGATPLVATMLATSVGGMTSLALVASPVTATGLLYLLSTLLAPHQPPDGTVPSPPSPATSDRVGAVHEL